ncbi:hypothetical protein BRIN106911_13500 [Brevibacillus invocatus]
MKRVFKSFSFVLLMLILLLVEMTAYAHHPYPTKRHIDSTHLRSVDEYFCII